MIRVVLADDHPAFLLGLRLSLPDFGIEVVAAATSGTEAIEAVWVHAPDAVLLDVRMPGLDGLEVCRTLQSSGYDGVVIMLSTFDDAYSIACARTAGARGYLRKDEAVGTIAEAVRRLVNSRTLNLMPAVQIAGLTPREVEVLRCLELGMSNKQISSALGIGVETVKDHCSNVFAKLEATDRLSAVAKARELGLFQS